MKFTKTVFLLAAALCAASCLLFAAPHAAAQANLPRARDVVAPAAYPSLDSAPRGRTLELAVVLTIHRGFHINAHEVLDSYLIPTELKPALPDGFRGGTILYPSGTQRKFAFSADKPMNVYQQTAVIHLPLTILPTAPLGAQKIPLKLRYQACSEDTCLPPVTLDLQAEVNVTAAGSKPHATQAHADLFAGKGSHH